ncbi:MAG: 50S ribosomal protein L28 [Armatimonadetes bacterium]|nr:50S ribosomal protein L28 [Armatimonadota bacterium]
MAKSCAICGKEPMAGRNIRNQHSVGWRFRAPRTRRMFLPNLQSVKIPVNGQLKRSNVCTKCIKAGKALPTL